MKFYYKCLLQKVFSKLNSGVYLNYYFQKYITKTLPIKFEAFENHYRDKVQKHLNAYEKYSQTKIKDSIYYEFGAGWDLMAPLCCSSKGMKRLHCIDVRRLIFPELISNTLELIKLNREVFNFSVPHGLPPINKANIDYILKNNFNLEYEAPQDAQKTNFQDDSIDFIVSNVTFEHIPENIMTNILKECYRVLKPNGIMSVIIDYQDHWAYFDRSITKYNFLKYSKNEWRKFNPSLHYQNRLRHKDYLNFIKNSDFKILEDNPNMPSEIDLKILLNMSIDEYFLAKYKVSELGIKNSHIVLTK